MKTAIAQLSSSVQYSQSRVLQTPRRQDETPDDHEQRCWRERIHVDVQGRVFIPPTAFSIALQEAARFRSERIPGKGIATYTKHFRSGVFVTDPLTLDLKAEDVTGERLFLNADGKRGGGTRVWRIMPRIESWAGAVTFYITDDIITEDVFHRTLVNAGKFIGIGRFRPQNGGFYGRFAVDALEWQEMPLTQAAE